MSSFECIKRDLFFSTEMFVVGTQKNPLIETILLSTQNTGLRMFKIDQDFLIKNLQMMHIMSILFLLKALKELNRILTIKVLTY